MGLKIYWQNVIIADTPLVFKVGFIRQGVRKKARKIRGDLKMNKVKGMRCFLTRLFLIILTISIINPKAAYSQEKKTWKYVEELTPEELAQWQIDPRSSDEIPKHPQFPWLPVDIFPFEPPFSAEEIVHLFNSIAGNGWLATCSKGGGHSNAIDSRNHLSYAVNNHAGRRVASHYERLYKLKPGDLWFYSFIRQMAPPADRDLGYLTHVYNETPDTKGKIREQDRWVYLPALKRIRRITGPSGQDNFYGMDLTYDDYITRDAWESNNKIIGIDILYETIHTPKFMGLKGPYTKDGGVECYVVLSKFRDPDYYLSKNIMWYDRHTFERVRAEDYDQKGNLWKIRESHYSTPRTLVYYNGKLIENPWEKASSLPRDKINTSMSTADNYAWDLDLDHTTFLPQADQHIGDCNKENMPVSNFEPKETERLIYWQELREDLLIRDLKDFPGPVPLYRDKFPKYREIKLAPDIEKRIEERSKTLNMKPLSFER